MRTTQNMRTMNPDTDEMEPGALQDASKSSGGGANDVEEAWSVFHGFLKKNEARVTQARRIVFDRAMAQIHHFKADDLAAQLAAGPNRVSRATVYHTLALMVKAGFLGALRDQERHVLYERAWGRVGHDHIICERCGAMIEFHDSEIAGAIRRKCAEYGFQERGWRISIMGLCQKCASSDSPAKP
ncbi:MAG: transcriptional repressor [Candidatus Sumerlaeota bacterium]|nr:transcriptional repressor [Candidatus Sumerlaeota bacterium]